MPESKVRRQPKDGQLIACIMAGLGGCLPSLCNIAAASSKQEDVSFLSAGQLAAMTCYFIIALILCIGFGERRRKEAFILGIAAPAVIAGYLNGSHETPAPNVMVGSFSLFSTAYAEAPHDPVSKSSDVFWIDFKRGLGFNVDAEMLSLKNSQLKGENEAISKELTSLNTKLEEVKREYLSQISNKSAASCPQVESTDNKSNLRCPRCPEREDPPSVSTRGMYSQDFSRSLQISQSFMKSANEIYTIKQKYIEDRAGDARADDQIYDLAALAGRLDMSNRREIAIESPTSLKCEEFLKQFNPSNFVDAYNALLIAPSSCVRSEQKYFILLLERLRQGF